MAIIVTVPVVVSTVATSTLLLLYVNAPLLSDLGDVSVNSGSPNTFSISGKSLNVGYVNTFRRAGILPIP